MLARSGRLPQFTQITGTPASRSAGSRRCSGSIGLRSGRIVAADVVDPSARRAEIVLHVDDDDRGAQEIDGDVLRRAGNRHRHRRRLRHRHVDLGRRRPPRELTSEPELTALLDCPSAFAVVFMISSLTSQRSPISEARAIAPAPAMCPPSQMQLQVRCQGNSRANSTAAIRLAIAVLPTNPTTSPPRWIKSKHSFVSASMRSNRIARISIGLDRLA